MCTNPRYITVNGEEIYVKCGHCDTCRRQKQSDWAIKLINESKYHLENSFITLTFDDKILIQGNKYGAKPNFKYKIEASKEYFTKFIKRLRKKFPDKKITYYHVGEYGERTKRPHHHVLLFGINFNEDRKEAELSKSGKPQYFSQTLEDLWGCGRTRIQDVMPNNIIYIAGYNAKKLKLNGSTLKPYQTFSNRSKMSTKWIRKRPEMILNGYIEDTDHKKYRIPDSYKRELKHECEMLDGDEFMANCYCAYEEKILNFIGQKTDKEIKSEELKKEEIRRIRSKEKIRDF